MSAIELAPEIAEDFQRILEHLIAFEEVNSQQRVTEIIEAIGILANKPLIGHPSTSDLRALVIGKSSHGYIALYKYAPAIDTVFVLAMRSQPEAGYVDRGR